MKDNPNDSVELYCPMSPQAPLYEAKLSLLKEKGILNDTAFQLTMKDPIPETLLQTLRLQRLESNVAWPEGKNSEKQEINCKVL